MGVGNNAAYWCLCEDVTNVGHPLPTRCGELLWATKFIPGVMVRCCPLSAVDFALCSVSICCCVDAVVSPPES